MAILINSLNKLIYKTSYFISHPLIPLLNYFISYSFNKELYVLLKLGRLSLNTAYIKSDYIINHV
jgi:hypothetical protein